MANTFIDYNINFLSSYMVLLYSFNYSILLLLYSILLLYNYSIPRFYSKLWFITVGFRSNITPSVYTHIIH